MPLIVVAFLAQLIIIAIIIYILKKILDRMLIDLAVTHFEYYHPGRQSTDPVLIISHRPLSGKDKARLDKAARKISVDPARLTYQVNKKKFGGMVIKTSDKMIDFSLRDRLRQALPRVFGKL